MTQYNGWTNYATWRVNLEIFDGMSPYDFNKGSAYELGQSLKEYANELIDTQGEGLAVDYARAFLSEVNWQEIAQAMKNDHDDSDDDSDDDSGMDNETRGVLEHAAWYDTSAELA